MYSWLQRLRSLRHRFWYGVGRRIAWSRGVYRETPAGRLPQLPPAQVQRIAALSAAHAVHFERRLGVASSLNNYEYLDILDRAWTHCGLPRRTGGVLVDVGCASFWYAAALQAFFRPAQLVGVEVEGYRLFKNGHSRIDYAQGYLEELPNARFVVADYRAHALPADVVTAWFPFISAPAILAWRLPLSLLAPSTLLARIHHNLLPGGLFVMVNHGLEEAALAEDLCNAANFRRLGRFAAPGSLSEARLRPAVLTCWERLTTQSSY